MTRSIMAAAAGVAGLVAATILPGTAFADPPGTITVSTPTVPSVMRLIGGTDAGIAYTTDRADGGGSSQLWLKADGADPVKAAWTTPPFHFAMAGRMLFGYDGTNVQYASWNGPIRRCAVYPYGGVEYLPTGWAYVDRADGAVKRVTATDTGCTTSTFLATTAGTTMTLFGGDANGMVIATTGADGVPRLGYHRYADPTHPVALDTPRPLFRRDDGLGGPNILAGAILVLTHNSAGTTATARIPLDGSARTLLPQHAGWEALTEDVVAAGDDALGLQTVPVTGGTVQTRPGVKGDAVSDGRYVYSTEGTGEAPGIYRRAAATGVATLVVPLPATTYPTKQHDIALSPGRVYYPNKTGYDGYVTSYDVMMRSVRTGPGTVTLGAEQQVDRARFYAAMSASAGQLVYGGDRLRDHRGSIRTLPEPASAPPEMSGNRSLLWARVGSIPNTIEGRAMYDLRTGLLHSGLTGRTWPTGVQDLFGNHLIYVGSDTSIWVKDLLTGRSTKYRGAGPRIADVAVHGPWLAWVTACAGSPPCSQTLTIRNSQSGVTTTVATRGTRSLELSGGYLALDVVPGTQRQLRTIRLGTGTSTYIGTLAPPYSVGPPDYFNAVPRLFDIDDETIAWIDVGHQGKVAQLGAIVDPAKYLGNVIAPGSFSPNGDGRGDTWTVALPVSKALPTCTVTIYRGTTKVRILSCANTTGMVSVTWDGRTGSGAKLPTGRYTYRVSGRDYDGTWLRSYDGTLSTIWGPIDKTA